MPSDFKKIYNHPDREQIIAKLSAGDSIESVSDWLKEKYQNSKEWHLTTTILRDFKKKHVNLQGALAEDIKYKLKAQEKDELNNKIVKLVQRNKTYNEKLEELVEEQIDWRKKLIQILNVVETRFGQLYDSTQLNPDSYKKDYPMIQWLNTILNLVEQIRKVEGAPDQVIQHKITVEAIDEQAAIFQQAIQNTLAELDLNTASLLIDKLNNNIENLKHQKAPSLLYTEKDIKEMTTLTAKILPEKNVK